MDCSTACFYSSRSVLSKRRECFRTKIPDDWIKLCHLEIVCHNDCELYHNDWKMYYTNGDIRSQWLDYIFRVRIRLLIGSCRPSSGGISREFWWFDSVMMNNLRHEALNSDMVSQYKILVTFLPHFVFWITRTLLGILWGGCWCCSYQLERRWRKDTARMEIH